MSKFIESLIARHLPLDVQGYSYNRLVGGMSNETYRVQPNTQDSLQITVALTIIHNPLLWWKVEQEFVLRDWIAGDIEVPLPHLIDAGFDNIDDQKIAYILREFVEGADLDTILQAQLHMETKEKDFSALAQDLGYRLGVMHRHGGVMFGQVARLRDAPYSNWESFILAEIANEIRLIVQLPETQKIGNITAGDVQSLLPDIQVLIGSLQSALLTVSAPHLAHGDAHFKNVIAGKNQGQAWKVRSFIDTDEALSGDPEIDVTHMENWLHFTPYKEAFLKKRSEFRANYEGQRRIRARYQDRRLIYHALRSLSYLRTVFGLDPSEFLSVNPQNAEYVFKHVQILKSLAEGNALEDMNIPSLL